MIGHIDGSHIKIAAPPVDENAYVNRKGFHSLAAGAMTSFHATIHYFRNSLGVTSYVMP